MELGTIQYNVDADTTGVDRANQSIDKMADNAQKAGVTVDAMGTRVGAAGVKAAAGAKQAGNAFGNLRGQAQNLGWQLQDIAVQAQMGTSAFTIFSQQGSQLVSTMGKSGPLVGALIAVSGVVAGVLFNSFMKTSEAIEGLEDNVKSLIKEYDNLTLAQQGIVDRGIGLSIEEAEKQVKDLTKTIEDQIEKVDRLTNPTGRGRGAAGSSRNLKEIEETNKAILALQTQQLVVEREIAELRDPTGAEKDIQKLTDQLNLIDLTGKAYWEVKAAQEGVADAFREQWIAANLALETAEKRVDAEKEAAKEIEKAAENAIRIEKQRANSIEKMVESMKREAALMGETSREAKVLYDITNGLIQVKGGLNGVEAQSLILGAQKIDQQQQIIELARQEAELNDWMNEQIDANISDELKANKERVKFSEDAAERINGAFASAWVGVFDDADSAFDGIADSFKQLLAEMAHEAITKPIIMNIQQKFSGGSASSGNAQGASSAIGAGGWWGVLAVAVAAGANEYNKNQNKLFAEMSAEFRQGAQSTGTLLGMANEKSESISKSIDNLNGYANDSLGVNNEMLNALLSIDSGINNVAAGFARQFGLSGVGASSSLVKSDTLGANKGIKKIGDFAVSADFLNFQKATGMLMPGVAEILGDSRIVEFVQGFMGGITDKISKNLYSKKTSILDSGIAIGIGNTLADILEGGALNAFAYADVQTKKKVLGITTSNKVKTETEALDDILLGQLTDVFAGAGEALGAAADVFGLDFQSYIDKLIIDPQRLSLKDLEGDELTKEIEAFFSTTLDNWAGVLTDGSGVLELFQVVGEGAFETVMRLAGELNIFNSYADLLELGFTATGFAAVEASQNIAEFAGGFDKLTSSLGGYYQNFFTDEERATKQMALLSDELNSLGYDAVPTTREGFRGLVEQLVNDTGLLTEESQKQFAALINLQGVFAELVPVTEEAAEAAADMTSVISERLGFERDLLALQGNTAALRELERGALHESNRALYDQIKALEDLQEAEEKAAQIRENIAAEILSLEQQYFDLTATEAEKRNALLQSLLSDEARAIQQNINDWNDAKKAQEEAANLAKTIADEKLSLERQYFDLTSTEQQKRTALLESLLSDEARAIQDSIYAWHDAQTAAADAQDAIVKAMDALKSAASSAFDILKDSVVAERARIEAIVSGAGDAKSALEDAINAEMQKQDDAHNTRIDYLSALADQDRENNKNAINSAYETEKAIAKARSESLKDSMSAIKDSISGLADLFDSLNSTIADMGVSTKELSLIQRKQAQDEIAAALFLARAGGSLPTQGELDQSLSVLSDTSSDLFGSRAEMMRDVAITQNKLAALADITGSRVSDQERQLQALESMLAASEIAAESIQKQTDTFVSKYDQMIVNEQASFEAEKTTYAKLLEDAQAQYDLLTGIDTKTLSVEEALLKFNESILAADFTNAQEQLAQLDKIEVAAQLQVDALNGIDSNTYALNESFAKFNETMIAASASNNAVQLQTLNALVAEMKAMREDTNGRLESISKSSASTASSTKSLYKDGVQLIPETA